ncbi:hypothetical protein F4801DRAFT_539710 [Xylaria longipes]|nr:hypothetical protein F4801DRAFT_539710 [Xylaria longipes]
MPLRPLSVIFLYKSAGLVSSFSCMSGLIDTFRLVVHGCSPDFQPRGRKFWLSPNLIYQGQRQCQDELVVGGGGDGPGAGEDSLLTVGPDAELPWPWVVPLPSRATETAARITTIM